MVAITGKPVENKEYLIDSNEGKFKITIPSTWKVTYGRVQPTEGTGRAGYERVSGDAFCIRVYETEKQQRAIFTGVKSFRDLSIKLEIPETFDENGVPTWVEVKEGQELFARDTMNAIAGEAPKLIRRRKNQGQYPTTLPELTDTTPMIWSNPQDIV